MSRSSFEDHEDLQHIFLNNNMKIYTIKSTASIWQILNKSNVAVTSRLYDFGVTVISNLNVADATSLIWPNTLYFETLELHFENIS